MFGAVRKRLRIPNADSNPTEPNPDGSERELLYLNLDDADPDPNQNFHFDADPLADLTLSLHIYTVGNLIFFISFNHNIARYQWCTVKSGSFVTFFAQKFFFHKIM